MFYSGIDEKFRASKGVATYVDKKWEKKIMDYNYMKKRIITMKHKSERGYRLS